MQMKGFEIFDLIITDVNKKSKTEEFGQRWQSKIQTKANEAAFSRLFEDFRVVLTNKLWKKFKLIL